MAIHIVKIIRVFHVLVQSFVGLGYNMEILHCFRSFHVPDMDLGWDMTSRDLVVESKVLPELRH